MGLPVLVAVENPAVSAGRSRMTNAATRPFSRRSGVMVTAIQDMLDVPEVWDINAVGRQLREIHSSLRDQGRNPLESIRDLAHILKVRSGSASAVLGRFDEAPSALLAQAFQTIINDDLRSAFGQYLTPPPVSSHVAALMADLVESPESILDPFGGSGALLHDAAIRAPNASLHLIEINQTASEVATALAQLSGKRIEVVSADAFRQWQSGRTPKVDVVVMNPPFGAGLATESVGSCVANSRYPSLKSMNRVPVELLAMELASDVAIRAVVAVLPLSVLTNRGYSMFRSEFFAQNQIVHVTILPAATFAPYRGVAQSCVCVWRPDLKTNQQFVVRRSNSVGYDQTGRPRGANDLVHAWQPELGTIAPDGCVHLNPLGASSSGTPRRLGDIASVFRGKNPPAWAYSASDATGYLLKVGSLSGSMLNWPQRKRSRLSTGWIAGQGKRVCRVGDICLTAAAHTPKYIGLKVDLIDHIPFESAMTSAELLTIRLREDSGIQPAALLMYLRSVQGYEQMQSIIRGSTAHLYPDDLADIVIPDLDELLDQAAVQAAFVSAAQAHRAWLRMAAQLEAIAGTPMAAANLLEGA